MSEAEANRVLQSEYMKNVKWKTARHILWSTICVVFSVAAAYYGLEKDILNGRVEARENLSTFASSISKRLDSMDAKYQVHFQKIDDALGLDVKSGFSQSSIDHLKTPEGSVTYYVERKINGKMVLLPATK